jgi:hypothetical protein
MVSHESIAQLQKRLHDVLLQLPELRLKLQEESVSLPHDWEVREQVKSATYYCRSIEQSIARILQDPYRCNDIACLTALDTQALHIAKAISFASLSILIKTQLSHLAIDPVLKGQWAADDLLPVEGKLRDRIVALVKPLGDFTTHISALRDPERYPWKERRSAEEIALLAELAETLETELVGLLSDPIATVGYSHYLQLETMLGSYEHFEAHALGKSYAHWQSSITVGLSAPM